MALRTALRANIVISEKWAAENYRANRPARVFPRVESSAMGRQIEASRRPLALIAALFLIYAAPLHAETLITGTPEAVQIEARGSSLAEMLNILASRFGLHYRTEVTLDRVVTGTYK